ncbi:MAG: TlpA family protein disulfide reductase [Sphaerochaetaceae bacterium]
MKVFTILPILLLITLSPLIAKGQSEEVQEVENSMMMMSNTTNSDNELQTFIRYKDLEQVMMLAEEKPTVLFFNATWCPECRTAREDFTAHHDLLRDVHIILVDYDNSDDLQVKYGVTYQHTFVQIDKNGKALTKWNGGATEELLAHVVTQEV